VLITHDMGVVAELADRILVMYAGRAAEIGAADSIMHRPAHPYTQALMLSAMIAEAPAKSALRAIVGSAPALDARPGGCPFHPRCPHAQADCRERVPELRPYGDVLIACHHPAPAPA